MKLLILDKDTDYLERFQHYLSKKYTHMQISVCDNIKTAKSLAHEDTFDVLLFSAEFDDMKAEELAINSSDIIFAYISDTNEIINGQDTLFKYLSVSELYSGICELYEKKKNRVIKTEKTEKVTDKKTEIITFLPVHGGAGSSTMAAACTISFASEYNTLYINLEQRPSDSVFFSGENKKGLTDIIAFLKTKYTDEGVSKLLKSVIQKDQKQQTGQVSFIKGYTNIMDCLSTSEQNLEVLLDIIQNNMDFRYVIIDADFIVSPVLQKLIVSSDKLVFVSSGSDISNDKLSKIHRYLELLKRDASKMPENYLLLNQYYGMNDESAIARNMEVIARLARYRTGNNSRITSQNVINQVLSNKDVFTKLKSQASTEDVVS